MRSAVHALLATALTVGITVASAQTSPSASSSPIEPLDSLDVPAYMGTWFQLALFPNRFQRQCASDTRATYRRVDGGIEVVNQCRTADGRLESATGLARPEQSILDGDRLRPARLEVSFLPRWLRWLPIWGRYWVLMRAEDGRFAVVGEPTREYLWVLARQPVLAPADEVAIRSRLGELGYDLSRWQAHPQPAAAATAAAESPISPQRSDPAPTPAARSR
jgi:apolipoprotein D and lipocalin family protein